MEKIDFKKKIKKRIIIWTLFSVAAVPAIPLMIVFLVLGNWFVAIPCMALLAFDVIALPVGWSMLGVLIKERNIVRTITEDHVFHIKDLSVMYNVRDREMKETVAGLIRKSYLRGYKFNNIGTELIFIDNPTIHKGQCRFCGAPVPRKDQICPYCGGQAEIK